MRATYLPVMLTGVVVISSTGCGVLRGIEQWKCNTFGMCHFGVTPTNDCSACPPPTLVPPPGSFPMEESYSVPTEESYSVPFDPAPMPMDLDSLPTEIETLPPMTH